MDFKYDSHVRISYGKASSTSSVYLTVNNEMKVFTLLKMTIAYDYWYWYHSLIALWN